MSGFTTKTTIPLQNFGYRSRIFTVLIDNHVWILHSDNETRELHKFNTGTFQLEMIDCVFPEEMVGMLAKVTSDQHNIYVFICGGDSYGHDEFVQREVPIFKFDIDTLKWGLVTKFDFGRLSLLGPIVDNQLHFVTFGENSQRVLMKMDLTTLVVEQTPLQEAYYGVWRLIVNNGQIYFMDNQLNGWIIVLRFVRGELETLSTYNWNNIEGETLGCQNNTVENGFVLAVWRGNGPIDASYSRTVYLDVFNPTTMNWNRTTLSKFFRKNEKCLSNVIINGDKIFAVFIEHSRKTTFSIQVYETFPNLSTICMLDLIDKMNDVSEMEPIIENLPIPLRPKLENMKWRIAANKIKLEKSQRRCIVKEIRKMEGQGLVDHRMQRKLRTEFDSNFSDSSDSDITDFDVEPHESTDDEDNTDDSTDDEDDMDESTDDEDNMD